MPLADEITVARGTDGKFGSDVYSVGHFEGGSESNVVAILAKFRKEGMLE